VFKIFKKLSILKSPLSLGTFFILGVIFFCLYQEWLIVHVSFGTKAPLQKISKNFEKKNIGLHFWKDNTWQKEEIEILWSENKIETITHLVNRWLSVADEEEALPKKVMLQNISLSESQNNVYLSFDRYPFSKESSTYQKCMIIEGLLKTLKESSLKVLYVHFLVHHKPIQDYHLDFSHPWPLCGFTQ